MADVNAPGFAAPAQPDARPRVVVPVEWMLGPHRRRWRQRPVPVHVESIPFSLSREGGVVLAGRVYPSPEGPAAPWLIHYYGSGMSAAQESGRLSWLCDRFRLNVVCVDLRGYGESVGARFSTAPLVDDSIAVYDAVRHRLAPADAKIHVQGFSLGASLASHVAAARNPASLILLAPPASAAACRAELIGRWTILRVANAWRNYDAPDSMVSVLDTLSSIRQVSSPLLVIHGDRDRTVSIDQGRAVFAAATRAARKHMAEAPGMTHCSLPYCSGIYEEQLHLWFSHP